MSTSRTFAGGATASAWQFDVRKSGAVGDGTTDDTAAIKAAVNAAYAYGVANGTYYAEVLFPPATYLLSGSLTQGGTTFGNAQIPLPVPPTTGPKFTLVLRGMVDAAALWHWQQTTPQLGGVTIRSTLVGTNDGTYGEPSVIGGPTPAQGYGQATATFANMLVVTDGIRVVLPNDPHVCGIDLRCVAEQHVVSGACMVNATPATVVAATADWQFGLATPMNNNNDYSRIGAWSAEGMNYGLMADEHLVADSIRGIYCVAAVECGQGNSDTSHGMILNYVSAEACQVDIGAVNGGSPIKVRVNLLDHESGSGAFTPFAAVNDPTDKMLGDIWVTGTATQLISEGTGAYNVNGAHALNIYDTRRTTGTATAPSVPASTTALRNPFWRDAAVHVAGGTVTVIKVDGVTLGVTSGLVMVPTGRTVAITYSSAPTWVWTLL